MGLLHKSIITIAKEKFLKFQTLNLLGHNGTKQQTSATASEKRVDYFKVRDWSVVLFPLLSLVDFEYLLTFWRSRDIYDVSDTLILT